MAGIYVHVPFCHAKCAYCDFYSIANTRYIDEFIKAISAEYDSRRGEIPQEVATLYFGGGTPSILKPEHFLALSSIFYGLHPVEFTIEVNPEDVTDERIHTWLSCGVDRVSMGVQSLIDAELRGVNRRHTAKEALDAIERLQKNGISNISADLIYGLPGQTQNSWINSLDTLLGTGITHLSCYCLSYEEGTLLYRRLSEGLITQADDDAITCYYNNLCARTTEKGFEHYEISNFALPGFRSRHNSSYWTGTPYLGLGPGAHSLGTDGLRRFVPNDIRAYINNPRHALIVDEESVTDRLNDYIMISLRTAAGLDMNTFNERQRSYLLRQAQGYITSGNLIHSSTNRLIIPESSWLISDAIIRDLFFD